LLPKGHNVEESFVTETFLKVSGLSCAKGTEIIEASIEKKGNNKAYTYTYKYE
jgi:hypothetical protein